MNHIGKQEWYLFSSDLKGNSDILIQILRIVHFSIDPQA
jgi:hypothetical protein